MADDTINEYEDSLNCRLGLSDKSSDDGNCTNVIHTLVLVIHNLRLVEKFYIWVSHNRPHETPKESFGLRDLSLEDFLKH